MRAAPRDGNRRLARDAASSLVARVLAMVASSATALLIASTLTKEQYGGYALVVGINVVLVMGLDLGLTSSLARYVAQHRADTALVIRIALLRVLISATCALAVVAALLVPAASDGAVGPLLPALAVLVLAQSLVSFHFGLLPSLRRIRLLLVVTVAQPVLELAAVLVVRARGGEALEMLLATTVAAALSGSVAWIVLLARGRAAAASVDDAAPGSRASVREVVRYGRAIFVVSLVLAVFGQVDQFVIGIFHPLSEVAPYALAIKLQALVAAPAITIAAIVAPHIVGAGTRRLALYRRWLACIVALHLGGVFILGVLASEAFGAIDPRYRGDAGLLLAMLPFILLSSIAPLPSIVLNQTGEAGSRRRIAVVALAINVVLDLALVPGLGAFGAAISTTVAFLYYLVRHHRVVERALAVPAARGVPDAAGQDHHQPTLARLLLPGAVAALAAASAAAGIRAALDGGLAAPPGDLVTVVLAGVPPALAVAWWASRDVRRDAEEVGTGATGNGRR